jgi:hypothetical protein
LREKGISARKYRILHVKPSRIENRYHTEGPAVALAPLPAGAQFLNMIESVFSGMARAIIANSNYGSIDEARAAIDRYIQERNVKFRSTPKRAGGAIWALNANHLGSQNRTTARIRSTIGKPKSACAHDHCGVRRMLTKENTAHVSSGDFLFCGA